MIVSKEEDLDAPFGVEVLANNDPVISTTARSMEFWGESSHLIVHEDE